MDFNSIGNMIINILLGIGYFVTAIVIIRDILSCIAKKDTEGIIKAILSGVIGYAALFMVTRILDKVKDMMR